MPCQTFMNEISLKKILTLNFVLTAVLPMVIMTVVTLIIMKSSMEKEIRSKNFLIARSLSGEVQKFLEQPLSVLNYAETVISGDSTISNTDISSTDITPFLEGLIKQFRYFSRIQILDHKGCVTHLAPFSDDYIGNDLSNQNYFKSTIKKNKPYWSSSFIASHTGKPAVALGKPIKNGVIVGYLDLDTLNAIIDKIKIGPSGYAALSDQNGTTIAHPDRRLISERWNVKNLNVIRQGLEGNEGTFRYQFMGINKLGSVAIIPPAGWLVIVLQPEKEAFEPVNKISILIWVGVSIAAVFALTVAALTLRKILTPLFQLSDNSRRIASGSYQDLQIKASYKEINELSESFSKMIRVVMSRKEKLRKSEEKHKAMIANILDVIAILDRDGTVKYNSPNIKKWFGWNPEELIGTSVWETIHPDDLEYIQKEFFTILKQDKSVKTVECRHKCKNSKYRSIELTAVNLSNDPIINDVLISYHDITERKQAEEEKINAQKIAGEHEKLALVGQIAGKMAHDFNNILGIIMGNTELSLLDCKDDETRKTLELIFEQTIRGKNLTKNLVAFARDQELKQNFFRINEKIDLVLNLLKKDLEGIEIIKEESPGVPDLLADPGMIEHALVNLIQNSIHAVSMVEYPRITVWSYCFNGNNRDSDNDNICFEIYDNGCGIPEEYLDSIFEPSFTLKGSRDVTGSYKTGIKGTGYGMANIKKYIELHKGTVSVESELGSGTKITISLPVIKKELTNEEKIEIREETAHFEKYILLVEDEMAISDVQYRILTQDPCNHKVDTANNGQVAMDLFERNKYDFVSLDYILPGNINGMDIYNYIRATDKTIPILFISGNIEFLESIKELKQKDADVDHLSKPCQNKDYVNSINKLLEKSLAARHL